MFDLTTGVYFNFDNVLAVYQCIGHLKLALPTYCRDTAKQQTAAAEVATNNRRTGECTSLIFAPESARPTLIAS